MTGLRRPCQTPKSIIGAELAQRRRSTLNDSFPQNPSIGHCLKSQMRGVLLQVPFARGYPSLVIFVPRQRP